MSKYQRALKGSCSGTLSGSNDKQNRNSGDQLVMGKSPSPAFSSKPCIINVLPKVPSYLLCKTRAAGMGGVAWGGGHSG